MKPKYIAALSLVGLAIFFVIADNDATEDKIPRAPFNQAAPQNPAGHEVKLADDADDQIHRSYLAKTIQQDQGANLELAAIKEVLEIDRKALRSQRETQAYQEALQDSVKIELAASIIGRVQEPASDESLRVDQSERMDAVLFLTRAIEWTENPESERVKATIQKLILDDAVARAQDLRLKKSLTADRIELFANLKSIDNSAGHAIEQKAQTATSKKMLQFANNFYRLNESGKR